MRTCRTNCSACCLRLPSRPPQSPMPLASIRFSAPFWRDYASHRVPEWQRLLRDRLDVILSLVLLPLFFALTGLRTRLDLLTSAATWLWTGVILLLAIAGKMGRRRSGYAAHGTGMEIFIRPRCFAQHARPGRTDRAEYCLQRACVLAYALHHAGRHGAHFNRHNGSDPQSSKDSIPPSRRRDLNDNGPIEFSRGTRMKGPPNCRLFFLNVASSFRWRQGARLSNEYVRYGRFQSHLPRPNLHWRKFV